MKKPVIVLILLSLTVSLQSSHSWELMVDKDDVVVYRRKVHGSKFYEVLAKTTVKTKLFSLIKIWEDVTYYPKWFYSCSYADLTEKVNRFERIIYLITDSPTPLQDRDNYVYVKVKQHSKTRVVEIDLKGIPDYKPRRKKYVRVAKTYGKILLTPQKDGQIEVSFYFFLDPGGKIPSWLVNAYAENFYYHTLKNMRKTVFEKHFQEADYPFLLNYPE